MSYWLAFELPQSWRQHSHREGQDLDLPVPPSRPSHGALSLGASGLPETSLLPPNVGHTLLMLHRCSLFGTWAEVLPEDSHLSTRQPQLNSLTSLGRQHSCIRGPLLSGYLPPLHVLDLSAFHLPPCSFGNSGRPTEASRLGDSWRALAWSQGAASHPATPVRSGKGLLPSLCAPGDTAGSKSAQTGWW